VTDPGQLARAAFRLGGDRVRFDLAAELHLHFDAVAVAYRKAMRDLGLAASAPIGSLAEQLDRHLLT
jgi:hypothetical protein